MSEERLIQDYLIDILESIKDITDFTDGMTIDQFSVDRKTVKAVIRCLEVIGEAANKIPNNVREKYPEVPWIEIIGMRNRLIHEYFGVDVNIIWQTIQEDIKPLYIAIKKLSGELL
jgi:uncharacterized protein with HEPN domain